MLCGGEAVNGQESAADQRFKERQESAAVRRFEKAKIKAEQGRAIDQFVLGVLYFKGEGVPKDYWEAAEWYRKAAEQGDALAQHYLAMMYINGQKDGPVEKCAEAAKWLRKAAEQGVETAQFVLGVLYFKGEGVPKNYVESYAWLLLAKANGDKKAIEAVSNLETYLTAEQMEKGQARTAKWFRKWAEQGYDLPQYNLGVMYHGGHGVPKDEVEAYAWFRLAKANANGFSEEFTGKAVSNLEKDLTAEQIEQGQARAAELRRLIEQKSAK